MDEQISDNSVEKRKNFNEVWHISEILLALSGLFILISVFVIYAFGNFTLWTVAKIFYGVGVLLVVKYS